MVYSAKLHDGNKVIVKAMHDHEGLVAETESQKLFVNFLEQNGVSVSSYVEPGFTLNKEKDLLLTVTRFAKGGKPGDIPNNAYLLD